MNADRIFFDTNILVYAFDSSAGSKHEIASNLLHTAWQNGQGVVSTQVLQEFHVVVTQKIQRPLRIEQSRDIIRDLLHWQVISVNGALILQAINLQQKERFSYWDSLIVAAAIDGGCSTLLSEDIGGRKTLRSLNMINPF